ncbi:MAG: hypothetical protein K9L32_00405 [Chromatiaceae bacterium]|nr:hypothetical protein [Chromatiaceae bacterium]MCF8002666.1 hypothetical protein [Chromatiaceae bacterium]
MTNQALSKRIEALEREQGINEHTVLVTLACRRCGHPLKFDDRGSACGTHPRIPQANTHINIGFRSPDDEKPH